MAGDAYDQILAAVETVFGRPATPQDDVFSMGGTSLHIVELAARLEDILARPVDIADLVDADTIHGYAAAVGRVAVRRPDGRTSAG